MLVATVLRFGRVRIVHPWMQQIGKLEGSSHSAAKAKACRENGKRGGHPKDTVAA